MRWHCLLGRAEMPACPGALLHFCIVSHCSRTAWAKPNFGNTRKSRHCSPTLAAISEAPTAICQARIPSVCLARQATPSSRTHCHPGVGLVHQRKHAIGGLSSLVVGRKAFEHARTREACNTIHSCCHRDCRGNADGHLCGAQVGRLAACCPPAASAGARESKSSRRTATSAVAWQENCP